MVEQTDGAFAEEELLGGVKVQDKRGQGLFIAKIQSFFLLIIFVLIEEGRADQKAVHNIDIRFFEQFYMLILFSQFVCCFSNKFVNESE